ncbi:MAG TPA: hypothetical protein ENJ57_00795, partial [Rhizobiales bacterium]|nr:hypothetical protein [Hyphomicrobiales bacterium]
MSLRFRSGEMWKGKVMKAKSIKIRHAGRHTVSLALATVLSGLFAATFSTAQAAPGSIRSGFGPIKNGIVKPVHPRRKTYSRGASLRKEMARRYQKQTVRAAKRGAGQKNHARRASVRSTKGMKRAFVGSYAPGSVAAPAPIFSQATLDSTRSAITRYEAIVKAGGWTRISRGKGLKLGDVGERVAQVKQRLMRSGDFPLARSVTNRFDEVLVKAVRRFQGRHGLAVDGKVGG